MAIGFGCGSQADCEEVLGLVRRCAPEMETETVLATLDRRRVVGGEVAERLGLRLVVFSAGELAQVKGISVRSSKAEEAVGTGSVAEAAALLALGVGARLVVARQAGVRCTCAVAVRP